MSDQYYDNEVLNTSVLVEGVVWQQIENGQSYQNDTFLTADEGCNETQYFSILESCNNSTILNDISGIGELNNFDDTVCAVNAEPDFYRIEGSDDLFAFDIACDDDGNLQRYRYRLRLNENGEYEGIPESIELVPFESDNSSVVGVSQMTTEQQAEEKLDKVLVKNELIPELETSEPSDLPDEDSNDLHVNEEMTEVENRIDFIGEQDDYESCNRILDSKAGIIEEQTLLPITKVETVSHCKIEESQSFDSFDQHNFNSNNDNIEQIGLCTFEENEHTDISTLPPAQNPNNTEIEPVNIQFLSNKQSGTNKTNRKLSVDNTSEAENTDDTDDEEYDIVDGVHVTGDSESPETPPSFIQEEQPLLPAYVLQIPAVSKRVLKGATKLNYSMSPEKENVANIPQIGLIKTNPRSLLKSSYVFIEQNENEIEKPEVAKIDKRFLKNKEFVQARLFSNYIAQTKILHAPVRQHRLPRKQTIKPVERNDEEIIVQEVVVSSKGFVETHEDGIFKSKIPLKATEIVHLSDSDDDYKPKRNKIKKKSKIKENKDIEIIISDSNDEETNTQIKSASDSEEVPVKKRRGRPPKRITNASEKPSSPTRTNGSTVRTRWKCTDCPKNFPSQGSLKSHMQYHNFHDPKYKCLHCTATFKNNILLSRHAKTHVIENKIYQCITCKKKFTSQVDLTNHKRLHLKDMMLKVTDVLKCSPKSTNKSPTKHMYHVCHFCPKRFSTADLLTFHQKTHMRFSCKNCSLKFASQLMLEDHVRHKCVKSPKRLTLIPQIVPASKRTSTAVSERLDNFKKPQSSTVKIALPCDICTNKFSSSAALYKHQIIVHNFNTPDKMQIINESRSGKKTQINAHSSIPANAKLRSAYAKIRTKLEL